ncbi:alpha-kinase family protein [Nitzschia inconspicua]|uniref:Alpha-kinase family protein n=1 Tax=Nitzschia inconspicua TaxID=303405 RepID=A0A9K3LN27_9STRA|nr:alpha-kinase family protein [Nitzschia inconspicua]
MHHLSTVIDLDDDWAGVDVWEDPGILAAEEASVAEKEASGIKAKLKDEEEHYEALAERVRGQMASKSSIKSQNDEMVRSMSKAKTYRLMDATKETDVRTVLRFVREAEAVDLAFVLDCTGSMAKYIEAAKSSIQDIARRVMHTNPDLNLRVAVVGYRDISDANRFEVLDFTTSINDFESFVAKLVAEGGADAPEDVAGAIQKTNGLSWNQTSRVVFLICDYPCHGTKYHDYTYPGDDYHPDGTPGICIESELNLLKTKVHEEGEMNLYFGRINNECDKMIRCFGESGTPFEICALDDPQKLTKAVSSGIRKSISKSVTASRSRSRSDGVTLMEDENIKAYQICEAMPTRDEWDHIPHSKVDFLCNKPITSINDLKAPLLFGVLRWGESASSTTETKTRLLQRAKNPFARGESRLAYYGRIGADTTSLSSPKSEKILKEFLKNSASAEVDRKQYLSQMEVSTIANFLAEEYNKSGSRPDHCPKIRFLNVIVVEEDSTRVGNRFCAEDILPVDAATSGFTKFSNNTGYWNEDEINQSLLLFTRFTLEITNGYLMVTDLQGVRNGDEYVLTDPALLCKDKTRFGGTNLGDDFMKRCMDSTDAMLEENGWDD